MLTKLKPVWRLNTGIEPDDKLGHVLFHNGDIHNLGDDIDNWDWGISTMWGAIPIYAYETNRTRKAKYNKGELIK